MLEEIFTKIGEKVAAEWALFHDGALPVTVEITDDAVNYQQSPPRLVFVAGGERWVRRDFSSQDGKKQPRQLFTRRCGVTVHCWGESTTNTEELVHSVGRNAYLLLYGSFEPEGGTWLPRSTNKLGSVYLFEMTLSIPVPRLVDPSVPISDFPTDGSFVHPI